MELNQPTKESTYSPFFPADVNRPPYSYKELIIKAFELVKAKPLELRDIYFLISGIFPYYKPGGAWQSAVRHVLLSDPIFSTDSRTNLWRISYLEAQIQHSQSLNLNIFENQFIVPPTTSLFKGNSDAPAPNTNFNFYESSEDYRNWILTQKSNVNTISSYTTCQPRMSSYEISNSCFDSCSRPNFQEVANLQMIEREHLLTRHCFSGNIINGNRLLGEPNFKSYGQPIKPSVVRVSSYDAQKKYMSGGIYSEKTNSKLLLDKSDFEENKVEHNSTLNILKQGDFRFHNNLYDCRYSGIRSMRSENSQLDSIGNLSLSTGNKDFNCIPPINTEFSSHHPNYLGSVSNQTMKMPGSFCPYKYFDIPKTVPPNQIPSQLISVNIHAAQCSDQTKRDSFSHRTTSSCSLQSKDAKVCKDFCADREYNATFTNHAISNLIGKGNSLNMSKQNYSYISQNNTHVSCSANTCLDNVPTSANVDSPSLSSINDLVGDLSSLSSTTNMFENHFRSGTLAKERKETNWEASLININIHLSALEKNDELNCISNKNHSACDTISQNIPTNINDPHTFSDQDNQEDSSPSPAVNPSISEPCFKDTYGSSKSSERNLKSSLPELAKANVTISESAKPVNVEDNSFSLSNSLGGEESYIGMDHSGKVLTSESNILSTKCAYNTINDNNSDHENVCANSSIESPVELDSGLRIPSTNQTSNEISPFPSFNETNVGYFFDNLEIQTSGKSDFMTDLPTESHKQLNLTAEASASQKSCSVNSESISFTAPAENISFPSFTDSNPSSSSRPINGEILYENNVSPVINNVKSNKELSEEVLILKNKVKQCHVVLERIKLPIARIKPELCKKNENCTPTSDNTSISAISSTNSIENEDVTIMPDDGPPPPPIRSEDSNKTQNLGSVIKKPTFFTAKVNLPQEVGGFTKPSYNYCRLITQALATIPNRKATANQICDMIAKKHPYYEHLTNYDWRSPIYAQLRTRKKFFSVVGTDNANEIIWSFNPAFEQYMLDKWVPKYVKNKSFASSIESFLPWLPKALQDKSSESSNNSVIETPTQSTTSSESPTPVIVFSGSLVAASSSASLFDCNSDTTASVSSDGLQKDPLQPESVLLDPNPKPITEDEFRPWEPEITVNEKTPNYQTQPPSNMIAVQIEAPKEPITKTTSGESPYKSPYNLDFSLDNCTGKGRNIDPEEMTYRINFNREHKVVSKFRLHCTVCDDHLGTSGSNCQRKARLHADLGVLVCSKCYERTCNRYIPSCQWCGKTDSVLLCCFQCNCKMCCRHCLERNFGASWYEKMACEKEWKCFRCDPKPIWPHRAIAHFLFQHYRDLKGQKYQLSRFKALTPKELRFFIRDSSTCCRTKSKSTESVKTTPKLLQPLPGLTPVVSTSFRPPVVQPMVSTSTTTAVPSQPLFVIGEQSPNFIYLQTPSSTPSVTLNTGTQYIHNVYPDKNYVAVDKAIKNSSVSTINSSNSASTVTYSRPPTSATAPEYSPPFPYSLPKSPPPPYSPNGFEVSSIQGLLNGTVKELTLNACIQTENVTTSAFNNTFDTSNSEHEIESVEPIVIHDDEDPVELKTQGENVSAAPVLSLRERIERRPMPKSKKQSLLRTVLMSESIESMKRHLQLQTERIDVPEPSTSPKVSQEGNKNLEEPILKSIIETATERLLNLQRNQNGSLCTGNSIKETSADINISLAPDSSVNLCKNNFSSNLECNVTEDPIAIPKIKIKTLKELQDPDLLHGDGSSKDALATTSEAEESNNTHHQCKIETQGLCKNKDPDVTVQVNITDLKQGIIEASRTLINTQKQFKELAKVISSNLIYNPEKAVELITKFHDILKTCHQELDHIGGNVKHTFRHLVPNTDIILKKKKEVSNTNEVPDKVKKKKKKKRRHSSEEQSPCTVQHSVDSELEQNQNILNSVDTEEPYDQSPIKRKRDLVDFNPLGKKVIIGSPSVTEEDLRKIPNTWDLSSLVNRSNTSPSRNEVFLEELRRRQYLSKKGAWKKKNIWLSTKRKKRKYRKRGTQQSLNVPLVYTEEGTLVKKRTYKKRKRRRSESDDDDDKTYHPTNAAYLSFPRKRGRPRKSQGPSRPLRTSARRHPSTLSHAAEMWFFKQQGVSYLIKPCSVVLDRLDPKVFQRFRRRISYTSESEDEGREEMLEGREEVILEGTSPNFIDESEGDIGNY